MIGYPEVSFRDGILSGHGAELKNRYDLNPQQYKNPWWIVTE